MGKLTWKQADKHIPTFTGKFMTHTPRTADKAMPAGDIRLSSNIDRGIHLRLKIAAAKERTTIGQLIERLVDENLD